MTPRRSIIFLFSFVFLFVSISAGSAKSESDPAFSGSENCADCHRDEFEDWMTSHHAQAWMPATTENVKGDFGDVKFTHQGITTRFFRRDDKFWIETEGLNDKLLNYEIKYTVGAEPLQQYLIQTDGGRLQTLDIAWDTENKRWFMVFPEHENNVPGNALHWTGVYKNWNGRCADCHATGYDKGYDPVRNSFETDWAEIGVGCESCHGPAAKHVELARKTEAENNDPTAALRAYLDLPEKGLSPTTLPQNQAQEITVCASCHSRRTPLTGKSMPHGSDFFDFYDLAPLRSDLYFPDGQVKDEVYVLGSFYQSKMYDAGVQCSDCHNPHSAKLKVEGNALCAQCHNPEGNTRFPQLRKADYNTVEHMQHEPDTPGGQCVDCHMPQRTYMQVDPRRDHRFGIPSPQDTIDFGSPNACTNCHKDRTAEWAVQQLATWRPDKPQPASAFGKLFNRLDTDPGHKDNIGDLMSLIADPETPGIVRASAIERLTPYTQQALDWSTLEKYTQSSFAMERIAAVRLFARAPANLAMPVLTRALSDPARSVRISAARSLMTTPAEQLPEEARQPMREAAQEFFKSLSANADHPNTRLGMAGMALSLRNTDAALASVNAALQIDPQLTDAWIMRAKIEHSMMRPDLVEKTIKEAEAELPDAPALLNYFGNYLFGQRQYEKADKRLTRAYVLAPGNPVYGTDYAQFLMSTEKPEQALKVLNSVLKSSPDYVGALILAARAYGITDQPEQRIETIEKLRSIAPDLELPEDLREIDPAE